MGKTLVEQIRSRAGMTQTELAAAAGTSQPTISAYEHRTKQPSLRTLRQLGDAVGIDVNVELVERTMISETVAAIRDEVPVSEANALRLVCDLSVRLEGLTPDVLRTEIGTDPGLTGDTRWDAFVGAMAERVAHLAAIPVPPWTADHGRFVEPWWFVTPYEAMRAIALVQAPREFALRGVFIDEASLSGV